MELEKLWTILGGRGSIPSRAGTFRGPLLIMGGGRVATGDQQKPRFETVWDDYAKVRPWKGEIMAVNDVGMHLHDRVRHWVTLHAEYAPGWMAFRKGHLYGSGDTPMWHGHKAKPGIDVVWEMDQIGGTSGLFACFVALLLGYEEIVLAGVPMNGAGHYFDPPWYGSSFDDRSTELVWKWAAMNVFEGRVTSLSGRTKEWLGVPKVAEQMEPALTY